MSARRPVFLGIDGGGTRTRAMLAACDGRVLGFGCAGPGNIRNRGLDAAVREIAAAISLAWTTAGLEQTSFGAAACFAGCAGVMAKSDAPALTAALNALNLTAPEYCLAGNDTEAALFGGLSGRPGLVLIAGTGSFCLARSREEKVARCGGWGWLIDDVGSGSYLGREALRAVAFAADGRGSATSLTEKVLETFEIGEAGEIPNRIYESRDPLALIGGLAPAVIAAAAAGDEVARRILRASAEGLAEMVHRVADRVALGEEPEMTFAGSVACSGEPYQPMIEAAIRRRVPRARFTPAELPPVAGAVLRALALRGEPVTQDVVRNLRRGCGQVGLSF